MPSYKTLYPGKYMAKEALEAPKVIRITKITTTVLEGEKGPENKTILSYKAANGTGEIVWPKTNGALTAAALGEEDYDKWIGRLITIYSDPNVMLGNKKVGGIRVFGSPEMKEPMTVEITRPRRKKGDIYKLVPTNNKGEPIKVGRAPSTQAPTVIDPDVEGPDAMPEPPPAELADDQREVA